MPAELFWEMRQQQRIQRAGADASTARNKVDRLANELNRMSRKLERLSLACQALWELLRDNTDFDEEAILAQMQQIDVRDGAADGRIGHRTVNCPKCGRTGNSQRDTCLYCGAIMTKQHLFE